ncbi:PKD domain-containing protein [Hymenobacter canadensis]|uniref:PKD domain-containing protein n=1 Tax=Hymenobacter canadensis TaxID=2999067 RepID=A0ABY7LVI2_9BACT|nr:PKD domain-containing protein [Hymenobacter canadensis]WBA44389.1 PKD domain-containing protein [Hymenobacter canadensis]
MKKNLLACVSIALCVLQTSDVSGQRAKSRLHLPSSRPEAAQLLNRVPAQNDISSGYKAPSFRGPTFQRDAQGSIISLEQLRTDAQRNSNTESDNSTDDFTDRSFSVGIPASPTANSLTVNTGSSGVDAYTGAASVTIPLWEVKSREATLPITLAYSGGGVKVNDVAGWVGMGWHLNAGGVIARTMMGRPDDASLGYFFTGAAYLNNVCDMPGQRFLEGAVGNWDTQPDVFSFNFDGYSGQFVFDTDRTIRMIPQQPLTIIPTYTSIGELASFKVLTPQGVEYSFGTTNNSVERSSGGVFNYTLEVLSPVGPTTNRGNDYRNENMYRLDGSLDPISGAPSMSCSPSIEQSPRVTYQTLPEYNSTWYLTEKKMPSTGDFIRLVYTADGGGISDYRTSLSQVFTGPKLVRRNNRYEFECRQKPFDTGLNNPYGCVIDESLNRRDNDAITISEVYHFFYAKRLTSIVTASGNTTVNFQANLTRQDILGGSHALTDISVLNVANNVVKRFTLDYEYALFDRGSSGEYEYSLVEVDDRDPQGNPTFLTRAAECKRIMLKGVTESEGCNASAHRFSYTQNGLPRRLSPMQDWGGYFNDRNSIFSFGSYYSNGVTYPTFKVRIPGMPGAMSTSRAPILSRAQNCSLIGVTYPTGGTAEYSYELHKRATDAPTSYTPGIRVGQLTYKDRGQIVKQIKYNYRASNGQGGWQSSGAGDGPTSSYEQDAEFTYPNECKTSMIFIASYSQTEVGMTKGSLVGYSRVEEVVDGAGSTVSYFTHPWASSSEDSPSATLDFAGRCASTYLHDFPFPANTSRDYRRGLLTKQQMLNSDGLLVKQVDVTYSPFIENNIPFRVKAYKLGYHMVNPDKSSAHFTFGYWYYESDWVYKKQESVTTFSQDSPGDLSMASKVVTDYTYDPASLLLRQERTYRVGTAGAHLTRYTYTGDFAAVASKPAWLTSMLARKMRGQVVEKVAYVEKTLNGATTLMAVQGALTQYNVFGTNLRPAWQKTFMSVHGLAGFTAVSVSQGTMVADEHYRLHTAFDSYDDQGNLTLSTDASGISTGYIWGYSRNLLTSKVINGQPAYSSGQFAAPCGHTSFESQSTAGNEDEDLWSKPTSYCYEAKTGQRSAYLNGDGYSPGRTFTIMPNFQQGKYIFSAWVKTDPSITGSSTGNLVIETSNGITNQNLNWKGDPFTIASVDGWKRVQVTVDLEALQLPSNTPVRLKCYAWLTGGRPFVIDELRFHHISAMMETLTYSPLIGVTSKSDATGHTSAYEYDALNRLRLTRDDKGNITQRHTYNLNATDRTLSAAFSVFGGRTVNEQQNFRPTNGNYCLIGTTTYVWQFGDGATSLEELPNHRYTAPGTYTVTLTATNSEYGSATTTQQVIIVTPLNATICANGTVGYDICRNEIDQYGDCTDGTGTVRSVVFQVYPTGGCGNYRYQWQTFNAATQSWSNVGSISTSTVSNRYYLAKTAEVEFTVRCQVLDNCGNSIETPELRAASYKSLDCF